MASTLVDLVKITANSTGTGAITLGSSVAGYRGYEALTNGEVYSYSIQDGDAWEFGRGTFISATRQLIRTPLDSSDGGAAINLRQNAQISFVALSEDLSAVQLSNDAIAAAEQTTLDAAQTAADRAIVEAGSKAVVNGEAVYPNAYAATVPKGVTALSNDGVATGSGGTPGTYSGGVSGGPTGFSWQYSIGLDGKIASYQITSPGTSTATTAPTLSYPSGAIAGAVAPTATVAERVAQASSYWAVSSDSATLNLFSNVGGSPSPVLDPAGNQVKVYASAGADQVAALSKAWAQSSISPDPADTSSKSAKTWAGQAATSAANFNIEVAPVRYIFGKQVAFARASVAYGAGDAITADGYHFAKYSIRGLSGVTFTRNAVDGFWEIGASGLTFDTLSFNSGASIDASAQRYYKGLQVRRAFTGANTAGTLPASLVETEDGTIYIPKLSSPALDLAGGTAALETANFVFEETVVSSLKQIRRTKKSSGAKVQATTNGNNFAPRLSQDGTKLVFQSDRSGTKESWWQNLDGSRSGGAVTHPVLPRLTITPVGDSLTAGGYADPVAASFGTTLTTVSSVSNDGTTGTAGGGIGSQKADQCVARYGAVPMTCSVSGNALATGANTLTSISLPLLGRSTDVAGSIRTLRAWIFKSDGTQISGLLRSNQQATSVGGAILYETGSYYLYTFTPDAGQTLGAVPATAVIEIDPEVRQDSILLLWIGRNNVGVSGWSTEVKARAAQAYAAYKPFVRKIGILSVTNRTDEPSGSTNYNEIVAHNADLQTLYPDSYIDVRTALCAGTSDDTPNPTYMTDATHYNATTGKAVVAGAVISAITAKGWFA